jgi:methylmalonyl-CoA mutase C-terminal domain/subunit
MRAEAQGTQNDRLRARALQPPIRAVVTKVGLDGHDRGVKVVAHGFRDAGMEVIYPGLRRSPEELAEIVLQEDAEVLGLSILSGAVVSLTRKVMTALHERSLDDAIVVVGGIVSPEVANQLKGIGVTGAFGPGSSLFDIIDFTVERVLERRGGSTGEGSGGADGDGR